MADHQALKREAHRLNYQLRSTFFYRKLKEYGTLSLPTRVAELFPNQSLYDWSNYSEWGIGEDAFRYIGNAGVNLLQVFCHPKALREHLDLVAYYRNIAALPQKSVRYLTGIDPKRFEANQSPNLALNDIEAKALATLFNEHITLIIDSSVLSLTMREIEGLLFASTGAQIDGSWRNKIGEEAEKIVQRLLIKEAAQRGMVQALIRRQAPEIMPFDEQAAEELLSRADEYRGAMLTNKTSMLFASEPDITLISQDGGTIAVIEVKGGIDPAGALERYGAAKKSFDKALNANHQVQTVFVANSITQEVEQRLSSDRSVTRYFNLAHILNDLTISEQFTSYIFKLLDSSNI